MENLAGADMQFRVEAQPGVDAQASVLRTAARFITIITSVSTASTSVSIRKRPTGANIDPGSVDASIEGLGISRRLK